MDELLCDVSISEVETSKDVKGESFVACGLSRNRLIPGQWSGMGTVVMMGR